MSTYNLCFEQKYEKYQIFLSENLHFLVAKFSVYLNRHVFVMCKYRLIDRLDMTLIMLTEPLNSNFQLKLERPC